MHFQNMIRLIVQQYNEEGCYEKETDDKTGV